MKTSEQVDMIMPAMVGASKEMTNPPANTVNPFYKSKYTTLDTLIDHLRPHLIKNNLCVIQSPEIENDMVCLITRVAHSSGQWIETSASVPQGVDAQKMGASITYARRYSLSAMFNVSSEPDDDGNSLVNKDKIDKANKSNSMKLDFNNIKEIVSGMSVEQMNKYWLELKPTLTENQKPHIIKIFAERKAKIPADPMDSVFKDHNEIDGLLE